MTLDWSSLLIGFLGTVLVALIGYFGVVRKSKSDEAGIALIAWKELLEPLKEELRETKNELRQTKEELVRLRQHLEDREDAHRKEAIRLTRRIKELENINKNRA